MKKKILLILSYCIVAIIFCLIGLFIGSNINKDNKNEQIANVVGIYRNTNWNGGEAVLILNKDYTCQYPSGTNECTWSVDGIEIVIQLPPTLIDNGKNIGILSDNGIVLHQHFFEKVG